MSSAMDVQANFQATNVYLMSRDGVLKSALVGSALYMPDRAKDVDVAALIDTNEPRDFVQPMLEDGWETCGKDDGYPGDWCAIRKGDVNLMVTNDAAWFERYQRAMSVAAYLHLEDKMDRIAVCKIIRDGDTPANVRLWVESRRKFMKDDEL